MIDFDILIKIINEKLDSINETVDSNTFMNSSILNDHKLDMRETQDIISTLCWRTSVSNILSIREDSLNKDIPIEIKVALNDRSYTFSHKHNFIELAFVLKGTLKQCILGKDETFFEGEVCLINAQSEHFDYFISEASLVIFINIAAVFFDSAVVFGKSVSEKYLYDLIAQKKEAYNYVRFTPKNTVKNTGEVLSSILTEFWNPKTGNTLIIQGLIFRLFSILAKEYDFNLSKLENYQKRLYLFEVITEHLKENYQNIDVLTLQNMYNYNADFFNRLIKEFTGMTYSKYLQGIRLEKALEMINSTNLSIAVIAEKVGYKNLGFFYKIFYEKYKFKPGARRKIITKSP